MESERRTRTIEETAHILGLSRSTTFRLAKTGELPSIKIGRRVLVPLDAIERMLAPAQKPAAASGAP